MYPTVVAAIISIDEKYIQPVTLRAVNGIVTISLSKLVHRFDAFLAHRFRKTSKATSEVLLYAMYILLNLVLAISSGYSEMLIGVALNWGYLVLGNVVVLFVLATRNSVIRLLTGVAVDRSIAFHQMVGYVTFGCATLYMAKMWAKMWASRTPQHTVNPRTLSTTCSK